MNRDSMWNAVRMAWAMLARRSARDVRAGRPREPKPAVAGDNSRLFRARRLLQERLRDFAVCSGYVQENA
jgi:hypothetical protein